MKKEIEQAAVYRSLGTKPCIKCGENVIEVLESCPNCGQSLAPRWKCIYCKQLNTVSRALCYSCGQPPKYRPDGSRIETPSNA
jgi:RNA polymerase subunit RPABC4/transcription elongation factor Spt4